MQLLHLLLRLLNGAAAAAAAAAALLERGNDGEQQEQGLAGGELVEEPKQETQQQQQQETQHEQQQEQVVPGTTLRLVRLLVRLLQLIAPQTSSLQYSKDSCASLHHMYTAPRIVTLSHHCTVEWCVIV
jgi:hypothetical protein